MFIRTWQYTYIYMHMGSDTYIYYTYLYTQSLTRIYVLIKVKRTWSVGCLLVAIWCCDAVGSLIHRVAIVDSMAQVYISDIP